MIFYEIKQDLHLIHLTMKGEMTADEIIGTMEKIISSPDYRATMNVLVDAVKMATMFGLNDLLKIIEATELLCPHDFKIKCAAVFSKDVLYGIGRIYSVYSQCPTPLIITNQL